MKTFFAVACAGATALALLAHPALSQSAAPADASQPAVLEGLQADHITASVANMALERDWYIHVLGFKHFRRIEHGPDFELEQLSIPGFRVDLVRTKGSTRPAKVDPQNMQQGWVHIVFSLPQIDHVLSQLKAAAIDVTVNRNPDQSIMLLVVHDPEGNEIELFPR